MKCEKKSIFYISDISNLTRVKGWPYDILGQQSYMILCSLGLTLF